MPRARGDPARARRRLVELAVDFVSRRGVSDLSLRQLAQGVGTSHRMLLYHFGSKENLLVEVSHAAEQRQRELLTGLFGEYEGSLDELTREFWRRLRAPEMAPLERLFFELYARGLQGSADAGRLLEGVVDSWIAPAATALVAAGATPQRAQAQARLGLAVTRGLLLDLLATGDGAGVDAAHELFIAALAALPEGADKPAQAAVETRSPTRTVPPRTTSA